MGGGRRGGGGAGRIGLKQDDLEDIALFSNDMEVPLKKLKISISISSVVQSCPTLCDPMNCSTPGLPVYHQLPEPGQTHVHRVSDATQPSHSQIELTYDPSIPLLGIHTEK